jgi:ubiquinone/menaquinone biosynthesis C-methylase UbiE
VLLRHRHGHRDVGRFDEWAATYDDHWLQRRLFDPVQQLVVDTAARYRPDATAILDVGCGTGRLLRKTRQAFPHARLVGVDAAAGMIDAARRKADDIEFVQGTAESLAFPDGSFDLVVTTLSFHHWDAQREGLRQVHRVMRPGALFLLNDLVLQSWMVPFATIARARDRTHTLLEFRTLLHGAGFIPLRAISVPRFAHGLYVMAARC